jgi:hypothetical protein
MRWPAPCHVEMVGRDDGKAPPLALQRRFLGARSAATRPLAFLHAVCPLNDGKALRGCQSMLPRCADPSLRDCSGAAWRPTLKFSRGSMIPLPWGLSIPSCPEVAFLSLFASLGFRSPTEKPHNWIAVTNWTRDEMSGFVRVTRLQ